MAETDRVRDVAPELAVAALVAAATLPMTRLFADGLGDIALLTLALAAVSSWLLRLSRLNAVAAWATSTLLLLWFLSVRFFPGDLWGPFPTIETLRSIGIAVRVGAEQTVREVAPVAATTPLLLFVAAGIWLTHWLVHAGVTWLRNPLLAVASAMPLFAVPGAIVRGQRLWLEGGLFLAAGAAILYLEHRRELAQLGPGGDARTGWRPGAAIRLGVVAVLVTALATPALPGFGGEPVFKGSTAGSQVYFNPIVAIKPSLDDDRDIELLRVRMATPSYLRLTSLDEFDGAVWRERERRPRLPLNAYRFVPPAGDTVAVRQEIVIGALAGQWLPAAYKPSAVRGTAPLVEVDDDTLLVDGRLRPGLSYVVDSIVPSPDPGDLDRDMSYDPFVFGDYLALPRVPDRLRELAQEMTAGETTPYRKALAIQNELRTFAYDQNVAAGHSFADIVTFLTEVRTGYCEQFAGSMAVLLRILGIPSRVSIGFGIGQQVDLETYRISTREAHAWVEAFFPGAGWVIFEPTPRAGVARIPDYAPVPRDAPDPSSPRDGQEPEPVPSDRSRPDPAETTDPGDPLVRDDATQALPRLLLLAVALLVAIGLPALALLRRRARIRAAATPRQAVAARYVDFLEWCAAAGFGRAPGETPREHADRLASVAAGAAEPLTRLRDEVEEALFAPPNGLDPAVAARAAAEAQACLAATLGRPAKVRAALRWGTWLRRD